MKIAYLIHCKFDYYCQGTETTEDDFLVYACNFDDACRKLERDFYSVAKYLTNPSNPREFVNKTIL